MKNQIINEGRALKIKGAIRHDILSRFLRRAKSPSKRGKPQNISLVRQKNTKEVIINQEGTRMVKDGED